MIRHMIRGRLTVIGAALVLTACADAVAPGTLSRVDAVTANAAGGGTALFFNGVDANASTPLGTVLTSQIDNIEMDAQVRWDGPNAAASHQMIYFNGHGGVAGWGIILLGSEVCILQAGIDIPCTGLFLTQGVWQHVSAKRVNGEISVTLDEQTVDLGFRPVHPVPGAFATIVRTSIGGDGTFDAPTGDFHGGIDRVRVRDLATDTWIERWNFNEGEGSTAVGANGTVLHIGTATWARRGNP
jgi:hypothetical protein